MRSGGAGQMAAAAASTLSTTTRYADMDGSSRDDGLWVGVAFLGPLTGPRRPLRPARVGTAGGALGGGAPRGGAPRGPPPFQGGDAIGVPAPGRGGEPGRLRPLGWGRLREYPHPRRDLT